MDLDTRGKRPAFFGNPDLDVMMTALLQTMAELWATKERNRALEQALVDAGVLSSETVEQTQLPEAVQGQLDADQQAFLKDAFRSLGAEFQSLDERQQEIDDFQRG